MRRVLHLQQQVAALAALPGQTDHLPGLDAGRHPHVELAPIDVHPHAAAVVHRLQRYRQLGARVARSLRSPLRRCLRPAAPAEQALEEVAESAAAAARTAEDLFEIELLRAGTTTPEIGRRTELLARPVAARPQLVVGRTLLRVAQGLVGLVDRLELLFGAGLLADIRVVLAGQAAVGRLDLGIARGRLHAQHRVIVFELHGISARSRGHPASRASGKKRPATRAPRADSIAPPASPPCRRRAAAVTAPGCGAASSRASWGCRSAARRACRWR